MHFWTAEICFSERISLIVGEEGVVDRYNRRNSLRLHERKMFMAIQRTFLITSISIVRNQNQNTCTRVNTNVFNKNRKI